MAKTSSLFHCLGKAIHDPGRLLSTLNQEISETAVRGMFVTLVAGIYDPVSGQVRLANAGHLPVLRVQRSGEVCEYPSNAVPLGILPEGEFPCTEFELKDASLYLFTDGLSEARTERGARLEMGGLLDLITAHAHLPVEERVRRLVEAVSPTDEVAGDDRTLLLIEQLG
jgi:sigma-B regulation protein RsbU (phosphoserine phosphatase)